MGRKTQKSMRQEINKIYKEHLKSTNNHDLLNRRDDYISQIDFQQEGIKTLEIIRPLLASLENNIFAPKEIKYLDREMKEKIETLEYIHNTTCETCRRLIYSLDRPDDKRLLEIANSESAWESLMQCPDCKRFFNAGQRAYKHISEEEARKKYPRAFD
jgi:hypothetical protein